MSILNNAKSFTGVAGYYRNYAGLFSRTSAAETGFTMVLVQVNIQLTTAMTDRAKFVIDILHSGRMDAGAAAECTVQRKMRVVMEAGYMFFEFLEYIVHDNAPLR